jgi:hypothetical protein
LARRLAHALPVVAIAKIRNRLVIRSCYTAESLLVVNVR